MRFLLKHFETIGGLSFYTLLCVVVLACVGAWQLVKGLVGGV